MDTTLRPDLAAQPEARIGSAEPAVSSAAHAAIHPLARKALYAIAGSALVALSAHVSVPLGFTPVPLTLQPFAVLLLGLLLDPVTAFATLSLYLAEGAAGMPVFSPHGPGGVAQLLGPTGGYLMAAPVAAAVASLLSRLKKGFFVMLASAAIGDAILLITGAAWLGLLTHASLHVQFAQSIAPFLPTDAIKVVAAAICAGTLSSFRNQQTR
jgi:biotin transport system substrate-specific component